MVSMRTLRFRYALQVIAFFTFLGASGCGFDGVIREDFHHPLTGSEKLPIRVALLDDAGLNPRPAVWYSLGEHVITLVPGFPNAVKLEMSSVFQDVKQAKDFQQGRQEDLIVKVARSENSSLFLSLHQPGWKDPLAQYTSNFHMKWTCGKPGEFAIFLSGISLGLLSPIAIPAGSAAELSCYIEYLEQNTSAQLKEISTQIRADSRIAELIQTKKVLQASLAAGEQAERAGDRLKALEHYARAAFASSDHDVDRRLQDKMVRLISHVGKLPAIPEEAERRAVRAETYLKTAATDGYGPALSEMRQAVEAAPLWPQAYFNLGLTQEDAGQYIPAMRNLKMYLVLAPQANDAKSVQAKIYELEAIVEREDKAANPRAAEPTDKPARKDKRGK